MILPADSRLLIDSPSLLFPTFSLVFCILLICSTKKMHYFDNKIKIEEGYIYMGEESGHAEEEVAATLLHVCVHAFS